MEKTELNTMIFQSIFSFNFRPWICMHRCIRSKKIVAAAESQSTHLWNNFEVSIDIIGTCPAHVAAYSHVTSTSRKTFQDCKKALVYSDFAKTLHLNGFSLKCRAWKRFRKIIKKSVLWIREAWFLLLPHLHYLILKYFFQKEQIKQTNQTKTSRSQL